MSRRSELNPRDDYSHTGAFVYDPYVDLPRLSIQPVKYGINVNLVLIVAQGLLVCLCVKDQRERLRIGSTTY